MDIIVKNKPWFKDILKKPELQDITIRSLYEFYLINDRIYKILSIITSNSNISIRVLDWFVTNYSKKNNIIYELSEDSSSERYFNVFLQYKCQLKAYKKKMFDPFCRKQRIPFYYEANKCVITTVGQLNFFKWALSNEILKYVEEHLQEIINDMIITNKNMIKTYKHSNNIGNTSSELKTYDDIIDNSLTITSKQKSSVSSESERRRRHELSKNASRSVNIHNYSIVLSFD